MSLVKRTTSSPPAPQFSKSATCTMNVTNSERVLKSYCKSKGYEKPVYRISSRSSTWIDGHVYRFKHYLATVSVNGYLLAEGDGFSKRIARKKAAMLGLQQLRVLEIQNLWQDYRRVFPQGLLTAAPQSLSKSLSQPALAPPNLKLAIKASPLQIEEILPTAGSLTPTSLVFSITGVPVTISATTGEVKPIEEVDGERSRSESVNSSSNLLIAAAIEKLKAFKDDSDPAGWKEKEKRDDEESKKKPDFNDEDLKLFNELKPLVQEQVPKPKPKTGEIKKNELQQLISEVADEIEQIEEKGSDDLDL